MGVWWNMLTLQQLRALNDEQVAARVNERLAPQGVGIQNFVQPADFLAAQFYVNEIERRENLRVNAERDRVEAKRRRIDLGLELLIVVLIGIEIVLGIFAGRQQSQQAAKELEAFGNMQTVLANLQNSSQATADSLAAVKGTMESMNASLQREVGLFYDVQLAVYYDNEKKELTFGNSGRTTLALWGTKVGDQNPNYEGESRIITPGQGYVFRDKGELQATLQSKFPKGSGGLVPLEIYVKNERNEEFIAQSYFALTWNGDKLVVNMQMKSITPDHWSKRMPKVAPGTALN
jgi:hypothetical protein